MLRTIQILPILAWLGTLAGVEGAVPASPGKAGVTRDEWGHRPGPRGFSTVIIDAGHGGSDDGASSGTTKQKEKDLTLTMAKLVARHLSKDVRCVLTRKSDVFVDLDRRVAFANSFNNAILVSIHFNSGPREIRGPEVYYWRVDSYALGKRIMQNLKEAAPGRQTSRGLERRRLRLTRNPDIPCVLVECGYLSDPGEARSIAKAGYREELAKAIATAILRQRKDGDGRLGPLPRPLWEPPSRHTDPRE